MHRDGKSTLADAARRAGNDFKGSVVSSKRSLGTLSSHQEAA